VAKTFNDTNNATVKIIEFLMGLFFLFMVSGHHKSKGDRRPKDICQPTTARRKGVKNRKICVWMYVWAAQRT
jgi:hypothetical protein